MNEARPRIEPAAAHFDERGIPWSPRYLDVYHSAQSGLGQAHHVFLSGNRLPERWRGRDRFVILETGFGLGLNFLATWSAWRQDPRRPGRLHYLSVEKHPFDLESLVRMHAAHPELAGLSEQLRAAWPRLVPGMHRLEFESGRLILSLAFDDVGRALPRIQARADAFYLDGFAPARNPAMWSPEVLRRLPGLAAREATLATYSVAGGVARELEGAGFLLRREVGFAGKREMLTGTLRPALCGDATGWSGARRAVVVGAGFAGTAVACRLARRGWEVAIVDRAAGPAAGASGLPAAAFHPHVSSDDSRLSRLSRGGYLSLLGEIEGLGLDLHQQRQGGLIQLPSEVSRAAAMEAAASALAFPGSFLKWLDQGAASSRLGIRTVTGGWWFPEGGWLPGTDFIAARLRQAPAVRLLFGRTAASLRRDGREWSLLDSDGEVIASAPALILANAGGAMRLGKLNFSMRHIRGQLTRLPSGAIPNPGPVVTGACLLIRLAGGGTLLGATYEPDEGDGCGPRPLSDQQNLARLKRTFPDLGCAFPEGVLAGHVATRCVSPDRLPVFGRLIAGQSGCVQGPGDCGLFAAFGLGSRGLTLSGLGAEILISDIEGDPLPVETDLAEALDPARLCRRADFPAS